MKVSDRIYCFFFLDKASQIRQGYLEIIKMEEENEILIDFQNKGIFKFINKDINDINNDFLLIKDNTYKLYITEYFEKEEKIQNILRQQYKIFRENSKKRAKEKFKPIDSILKIKKEMKMLKIIPKVVKACKVIKEFRTKNKDSKEIEIDNINAKLRGGRNCSAKKNRKQKKLINEYLDLKDFFPKASNNKLSFPGLIGLNNIGATCYMNATLQCFSNIPKLRTYLLNKETYKDLEDNKNNTKKLSFALAEVLKNLWEVLSQRQYSPTNFKNIISEMNPLF
jgi:ubiquitin C-terminal hydrolase